MKKIWIGLVLGVSLLLTGCPTFNIGGWMTSATGDGKASFGGTFFCEQMGNDIKLWGQFQYTDHQYMITWKGKDRPLNFHGTYGPVILYDTTCEAEDADFTAYFGVDGLCGSAELKPAPRMPGDTGWPTGADYQLAFRIGLHDIDAKKISVSFGEWDAALIPPEGGWLYCPDALGIPLYYNEGFIMGGNINVRYPIIE